MGRWRVVVWARMSPFPISPLRAPRSPLDPLLHESLEDAFVLTTLHPPHPPLAAKLHSLPVHSQGREFPSALPPHIPSVGECHRPGFKSCVATYQPGPLDRVISVHFPGCREASVGP